MKNSLNLESGSFNPRIFLGFVLGSAGIFLTLASLAMSNGTALQAAASSGGATIHVTTTVQKIGGIGTGGCSLQEAIYSSVLHNTFDGTHGIAIDATDPDHFITTDCEIGTGNGDTIVLPSGGVFTFNSTTHPPGYLDGDAHNPYGPTATPIIFSTMTIEGAGATLQWTGGSANVRLFAVGPASITINQDGLNTTVSGTGGLTLRNVYITGFHVKGGDGDGGGGGGLGAGGAIYLQNGSLTVENSTFDSNKAAGGNGGVGCGSGGGGLAGNSGCDGGGGGGAGGGGARDGGNGTAGGGGGGGTVFAGGPANRVGGAGGYLCGGNGGDASDNGNNGHDAKCPGGGGGGAGPADNPLDPFHDVITAGKGSYGGGGGGAASGLGTNNGGDGGFGGGGGGAEDDGGNGGFGGGGGSGLPGLVTGRGPGKGGPFGGNAVVNGLGGGGGALGGAIFNDSGTVTIHNSTFTNNVAVRGTSPIVGCGTVGGCVKSDDGGDAGGAIFSRNGSTTIVDSTISGNQSTGSGGGVVVYSDSSAIFTLQDTIVANNGSNECFFTGSATATGVGNLVMNNGSGTQPFGTCPGVVTNVDPQLQALQPPSVNGGLTPTMAIPLYSSAMGVADPGTSLPSDQHFADRPQPDKFPRNGYDIGAFTVCRWFMGPTLEYHFCSETHITPPPTTTLTMQTLPSSEGITNPAPGTHNEDLNGVVAIQAIPSSGNHFTSWTGNVAQPSNPSTTVTMNQAQTVTANFATGAPSADLHVTVTDGKSAAVAGANNIYTIVVSNAGSAYVSGAVVKDTFPSTFTGVTFKATEVGGATGFTVIGSGNIKNTVTMPPGSSITYKATGKLSATATGTVSDTATVTAPSGVSDPNLNNNTATDSDNITLKADLKVTVTDGKTSAVAGSKNTYTIVVTNAGPSKVSGIVIHDTFPSTFTGVTYTATQSGGATGFSASGSGNINNTVTMPPGSKVTYKATGTISASASGSISDTATVTAPSGVTDPNTGNNSATDTDTL